LFFFFFFFFCTSFKNDVCRYPRSRQQSYENNPKVFTRCGVIVLPPETLVHRLKQEDRGFSQRTDFCADIRIYIPSLRLACMFPTHPRVPRSRRPSARESLQRITPKWGPGRMGTREERHIQDSPSLIPRADFPRI